MRLRERRLSAPPPFPATTSASPSPSASSTPRSAPTAPHSKGNAANELSNRDRSRALFFLVAVPYFKSVLDQYYHQLTSPTLDDGFENPNVFDPTTEESRVRRFASTRGALIAKSLWQLAFLCALLLCAYRLLCFVFVCIAFRVLICGCLCGADTHRPVFRVVCRQPPIPQFVRRVFHRYYRYFHAIYEGTLFIYQIRYLFSLSQYFSPFLHLTGQKVQRMSAEDMVSKRSPPVASTSVCAHFCESARECYFLFCYVHACLQLFSFSVLLRLFVHEYPLGRRRASSHLASLIACGRIQLPQGFGATSNVSSPVRRSFSLTSTCVLTYSPASTCMCAHILTHVAGVAYVLASYAKWGLLVGIFLFKFLEWWYSSENRLQPSRVLPVPPPPDEAQVIPQYFSFFLFPRKLFPHFHSE